MSYWIYSAEALPNPDMLGKPRYTPDASYIKWGGVALPFIPKQKWLELPESLTTTHRPDWRSPAREVEVTMKKFKPIVDGQFAEIGVIMLDHEPTPAEKEKLETVSQTVNLKWRKKQVEFFENQRDMAKQRQGSYDPSPYVDECYEILKMDKPYSVDALQALRDPGQRAAETIATAIAESLKEGREQSRKDAAFAAAELLTRPDPPKGQVRP